MTMTDAEAIEAAQFVHEQHAKERNDLDVLRRYVTGKQGMPLVIPRDAPPEVREMARIARINIIAIVVNALVESLFLDNIRTPEPAGGSDSADPDSDAAADDIVGPIWQALQTNKFDRRQSGLYRAVFTYGYGYVVALPGKPVPVVRAVSPRRMTAMYGPGEDFPDLALESRGHGRFRLYDNAGTVVELGRDDKGKMTPISTGETGLDYCPVVKYVDAEDLDEDDEPISQIAESGFGARGGDNTTCIVAGQVAPLMTLQDQADVTSFGLHSAQWYSAFRQRWIVGWTPENRSAKVSAAASQMWTFDADPADMALGEFSQTDLSGYLNSRQETLRYAATLSQTPVHELIGELVNLSAEALAAAEAGRDRKVELRKTGMGESHEQLAGVMGDLMGIDVPDDLEVAWRDTSARAFGAIVDGLGKLAQMLQIPPQMLWDRIPGVTRGDVERWKAAAEQGDALGQLTSLFDKQSTGGGTVPATDPAVPAVAGSSLAGGGTRTASGLIVPANAGR